MSQGTNVTSLQPEKLGFKEILVRIGPGLIMAASCIGPGSITTAIVNGSTYGYSLLWVVALLSLIHISVYGKACGEAVAGGRADRGIVCCGSGIGISIAANKVKGVRCALCTSVEMARLCRQHNNANMIALGGRLTEPELALQIVDTWLDTEFEGGRHQRRCV